jgi:hypothetical protein
LTSADPSDLAATPALDLNSWSVVNTSTLFRRRRFGMTLPTALHAVAGTALSRRGLLATLIALAPTLAKADESISGQWRTDPGHHVIIVMDVLADGYWTSETIQNNKVVAEMAGTYEQKPNNSTSGSIVFTPVKSKVSQEHGAATVEADRYTLENGGKVLRLVTSKNDQMVFRKQPYAKQ